MTTAFDFAPAAADGTPYPLAQHRGRVLLVVNVASKCGFTPQYGGLEALWRRHREAGLTVLGFPCNQFGAQEPGDAAEIASFCSLSYDVTFPVLGKVDVNGDGAEPLFRWVRGEAPGLLGSTAVKWNFTKFLVARDGRVRARYAPTTKPEALEEDVLAALSDGEEPFESGSPRK